MPKILPLDRGTPENHAFAEATVSKMLGAGLENGIITREQVERMGHAIRHAYEGIDNFMWCLGYNLESNSGTVLEEYKPSLHDKWTEIPGYVGNVVEKTDPPFAGKYEQTAEGWKPR